MIGNNTARNFFILNLGLTLWKEGFATLAFHVRHDGIMQAAHVRYPFLRQVRARRRRMKPKIIQLYSLAAGMAIAANASLAILRVPGLGTVRVALHRL